MSSDTESFGTPGSSKVILYIILGIGLAYIAYNVLLVLSKLVVGAYKLGAEHYTIIGAAVLGLFLVIKWIRRKPKRVEVVNGQYR